MRFQLYCPVCETAASKVLKRFLNGVASAAVLAHAALSVARFPSGRMRWHAGGGAVVLLPSGDECAPGSLTWRSGPAGLLRLGCPVASAEMRDVWCDVSRSPWRADASSVDWLLTLPVWGGGRRKCDSGSFWLWACKLTCVAADYSNVCVAWVNKLQFLKCEKVFQKSCCILWSHRAEAWANYGPETICGPWSFFIPACRTWNYINNGSVTK